MSLIKSNMTTFKMHCCFDLSLGNPMQEKNFQIFCSIIKINNKNTSVWKTLIVKKSEKDNKLLLPVHKNLGPPALVYFIHLGPHTFLHRTRQLVSRKSLRMNFSIIKGLVLYMKFSFLRAHQNPSVKPERNNKEFTQ